MHAPLLAMGSAFLRTSCLLADLVIFTFFLFFLPALCVYVAIYSQIWTGLFATLTGRLLPGRRKHLAYTTPGTSTRAMYSRLCLPSCGPGADMAVEGRENSGHTSVLLAFLL